MLCHTQTQKIKTEYSKLKDAGNKQSNGVQHKGMIDYEGQPKFLKLDDINPEKGVFEANYNVMYSSVSEAIVSTFVKNMVEDDH